MVPSQCLHRSTDKWWRPAWPRRALTWQDQEEAATRDEVLQISRGKEKQLSLKSCRAPPLESFLPGVACDYCPFVFLIIWRVTQG